MERGGARGGHLEVHTPSIAFRYLPPNSARIGYATEGALFISAQRERERERERELELELENFILQGL